MGLSKMLNSASAHPTWLDCQRSAVLFPHFCSVLTAKDLKFRFHFSALPWLLKTWSPASALSFCLDCQTCEVPLPHFRSVLTAKYVKFCFRTSALPWWQKSEVPLFALVLPGLPKMRSSASAFHLCLDFQRFAVSLPHFRSILTANDLKIGFSTNNNTVLSLPNMGSSASVLPFCLDCKRSVVSHFRSAFIPKDMNALLLCIDCQSSASQFRCRFILCISTQFRAALHEGLALQRDETSLFASKNQNNLIHT